MIVFLFVYNIMISSINEYDEANLYTSAARANEILSQQMNNIRIVCQQIRNGVDDSFIKFLSDDRDFINDHGNFNLAKKDMMEKLNLYTMSSQIIDEIYLFPAADNNIVSSLGSIDLDVLYGSLIRFGDLDVSRFREEYLNGQKYSAISQPIKTYKAGAESESLLYIESYPNNYFDNPTGYIVVCLDFNEIKKIMGYSENNSEQCLFLYDMHNKQIFPDNDNDVISSASNSDIYEINNKKYIAFSFNNDTGLNVLSGNLYNSAIKKTIKIKFAVIIILFAALLIGAGLSIYFAKLSAKPIKRLTKQMETLSGVGISNNNEFAYLSAAIDSICNDISVIKEEYRAEMPVIINDFVNSLLAGKELSNDRILQLSKNMNIDISGKMFTVLLTSIISDEKESCNHEMQRSIQKSVSEEYKSHFKCMTCTYGTDTVAIIFIFDDEDNSTNTLKIENMTYAISEKLFKSLNIRLKCAMGNFYTTINDVCYSYDRALNNLMNGMDVEYRHTVWCVQSNDSFLWYYYPVEIEHHLENAFRNKNIGEIDHIIDLVYEENCVNRVLVKSTMKLLYANMKITLYNLIQQYCHDISDNEMKSMNDSIDEESGTEVFFSGIKKVYNSVICENAEKSLKEQILDYVDNAALTTEFDRQAFADHFYISIDYVSKFFKENTGFGFNKYATKVKIEKSCHLLAETQNSIDKIAEAVGYNSSLSFRRAFKNYVGVSPSEYRHQMIESDDKKKQS
ncbi:MAG: helix-turn-helix transcriptional regulator [Clostridia bacterium]|nr:helix-turn-helix transcriptional regulator [Clostridia bacterium]